MLKSLLSLASESKDNKTRISEQIMDLRDIVWKTSLKRSETGGCFLKAIIDSNYYKLSNFNSVDGFYGFESIYEVIAYRLAKIIGINCLEQKLVKCIVSINNIEYTTFACVSENYLKEDMTRMYFEVLYDLVGITKESPIDTCYRLGYKEFIHSMFIFDYLIINRDRHGANIEILSNKKFAPLFDNGLSFMLNDIDNFDIMKDRPVNNFIGYKSLQKNLEFIKEPIRLSTLKESDKEIIFQDLEECISLLHLGLIWDIIWKRYNYLLKEGVIIVN